MGNRVTLNVSDDWEFREVNQTQWNPASVPGCVHTDLMANHLIPDPFYRRNEESIQWIGKTGWEYRTSFDIPEDVFAKSHIELLFRGLDTYAEVYLNGNRILAADNMFRIWRVEVSPYLCETGNHLHIRFRSVFNVKLPKWKNARHRLLAFPGNDQSETQLSMYSRKAQFHYGWDWGPRLITCGIWQPVFLEAWDNARILSVHYRQTELSAEEAGLTARCEIRSDSEETLEFRVTSETKEYVRRSLQVPEGRSTIELPIRIANPEWWWCNNEGEQKLYHLKLQIRQNGQILDQTEERIGLRTLRVVHESSESGTDFHLELNGKSVFMKGANYIPQDNFQNRVTPERYEHLIRSAADAGMNMLRVWGGGIYEEDLFYELCDEYGILIWQDFMFSCAMYPSDDDFLENVRMEVTDNVKRLRKHPCLALYCGNNEVEMAWYGAGWKQRYPAGTQQQYEQEMHHLFREVIPDALREVDPDRYYHPGSPMAGFGDHPRNLSDTHYWGVWHEEKPFRSFEDNLSPFVSEYGFQSYPTSETINSFTEPQDRNIHAPVMLAHQRSRGPDGQDMGYGNRIIRKYLREHYRPPKDFSSYVYLTQLLQAEGIRMAIETHRRNRPFCMGSLYWQLNDCWPAISWSGIDYQGHWKALHYVVRRAFAQTLLTFHLAEDYLTVTGITDCSVPFEGMLQLELTNFTGQVLRQDEVDMKIAPNSDAKLYSLPIDDWMTGTDPAQTALRGCLFDKQENIIAQNTCYRVPVKRLQLAFPQIIPEIRSAGDHLKLTLATDFLAKNVSLEYGNSADGFSDNYFDLFPGSPVTVTYPEPDPEEDFLARLRIRTIRDTYTDEDTS